ncbi:hypothetical protein GCM10010264_11320 [Streptomyces globisporus]|nr:hypothetical protein GCM10010264_11320 [Streptomyces globisporus]
MWALTAAISAGSGEGRPPAEWVARQGRQRPSGRASGWPGAAAVGALHEEVAGWGRGRGAGAGRLGPARKARRDLVREAAADEAGWAVDLGGESCGEGSDQIVGGHASGA